MLDDSKLGPIMRGLREEAGLSLRTVADRLGYSAAYVSDLELGRRAWSQDKQDNYRKALK